MARFAPFLIAFLAALGVDRLRAPLADVCHRVKQEGDVFLLPPPKQLPAATLGYKAALVDWLWADLLVQSGIHFADKRPFDDLERYIDGILALEGDFAPLYRYVDTLLIYRPPQGTAEDARKARAYLERGTRERPFDHKLWLQYGQFVAFLGPNYLPTDEEKDRWRAEGSEAIFRSVELGGDPDYSLSAAGMLSRRNQREANLRMLSHLERAYALADDPHTQDEIRAKIVRLQDEDTVRRADERRRVLDERRNREFPFLTRGEYLQIAPLSDPLRCTGPERGRTKACALDWADAIRDREPR